ncbi:MAG: PorV/PorQ family protein [Candidatus Eisenbacteria bacterium]
MFGRASRRYTSVLTILLVVGCWASRSYCDELGGGSAAPFLSMNVSARSSALGGAFVGFSDGASTCMLNPSELSHTDKTSIRLTYDSWIEDTSHQFLGVTVPVGPAGAFGLGVVGTFTDLQRRDGPTSLPSGQFSSYDAGVIGSYGMKITDQLSFGLSTKLIVQVLENERATGFAGDFGMHASFARDKLRLGAVIQNVGPDMKLVETRFALPRSARLGASFVTVRDLLLIAADYEVPRFGDGLIHLGLEVSYRMASLRVGYRGAIASSSAAGESHGITGGFGVRYNLLAVDYAFVTMAEGLGNTSMFSLGFVF